MRLALIQNHFVVLNLKTYIGIRPQSIRATNADRQREKGFYFRYALKLLVVAVGPQSKCEYVLPTADSNCTNTSTSNKF